MTLVTRRPELRSPLRFADYGLAMSAIAVALLGVALNYSATWRLLEFNGENPAATALRQLIFVLLGIGVMVIAAVVDYRVLLRYSTTIYLVAMAGLAGVLLFGLERRGARSWYEIPRIDLQIQPSEFAKLAVIVALAAFLSAKGPGLRLNTLINALVLVSVPMVLTFLQPDIGTMLVYVTIAMGVLLLGSMQLRHIVITTLLGLLAIVMVFSIDSLQGPELLRETQRNRLTAFLDPEFDTQGVSYNLQQSQIAIGAGGLTGQGWKQGSQTNLNLVPHQESDFIFTALGEEFGFVGGSALLLVYAFMIFRIWTTARNSRDTFGMLLCIGVLSMFMFQVFENVGMTMGIMPITGIPLPLMSHGGSSVVTVFAAIGLVINVGSRKHTV